MWLWVEAQPSSIVITTAARGRRFAASRSTASPSGSTGRPDRASRAMRAANRSGVMNRQLPKGAPGASHRP